MRAGASQNSVKSLFAKAPKKTPARSEIKKEEVKEREEKKNEEEDLFDEEESDEDVIAVSTS